ncbi:MAG: S-layer homology domain-containing protein [Clostridiales bacterium]|nr:S-layer homology domain-containing protein [Clostridiales bacterium]
MQVIINPLATQEQVETALAALLPSEPETDKSQLEAAIKTANSLIEEDYTTYSWAALQAVLFVSQSVYDKENAAQKELNSATDALNDAINSLIAAADEPISVAVTFQRDNSGFLLARQKIALESDLSERYGYIDNYTGEQPTALDALVAAHINLFGDEALNEYLVVDENGLVTKILGEPRSNVLYFVNGAMPGNGIYTPDNYGGASQLGDSVPQTALAAGDDVLFYILQDIYYMDNFVWFEDEEGNSVNKIETKTGEDITLTLRGYINWYGNSDMEWRAQKTGVISEAAIVPVALEAPFLHRAGYFGSPIAVTDDAGKAVVSFTEPGVYILSAIDGSASAPLISPWLEVTVTGVIPPEDRNIDQIRRETLAWLKNNKENPAFGNEWHVLALARSNELDENWAQIYLNNLETDAQFFGKTGPMQIHDTKVTENERLIIALTALGIDASDWNDRDLLSPLFDTDYLDKQGINGSIFGLIAFNSAGYEVPPTVEAFCLNSILENQLADKGWTLYGNTADPDTTSMVLQALAPYYAMGETSYNALEIEGVPAWSELQTSVTGAIQTLSNIQDNEGTYTSWGSANAENCAQVLTALCLLDINPATDTRFIKNGKSVLEALISFRDDATGGFKHIISGPVNSAATEHAAYALVAYWRLKNNMNALYDMTDVTPRLPSYTVDKTALNAEILKAENLNQSSYTSSSWNSLQAALTEAKAVSADDSMPQTAVNTSKYALTAAINALQTVGGNPPGPSDSIRVTFRLIGSTFSNGDIDLSDGDYKGANYVTWIPTRSYNVNENATVYDLFVMALADAELGASSPDRNYIESIYAPYILGSYRLSELINGRYSGWLYTINGKHIGYGLKEYTLSNNAEVVWHYVNDYRYEVEDWFEGMNSPGMGNSSTWNKWLSAPDRAPAEADKNTEQNNNPGVANGLVTEKASLTLPLAAMPKLVTEIEVKSAVTGNTAKAEANTEEMGNAIEAAASIGNTAIALTVTGAEDAESTELTMLKTLLNKLKDANMELVVNSPAGRIAFSNGSLESIIAATGETLRIVIKKINKTTDLNAGQRAALKDSTAIELTVWSDDNIIRYFDGPITVSIPYQPKETEDTELLTAYYLDDDGSFQEMKNAGYDPDTGAILFETAHFSKFFVSEWLSPFGDTFKEDWFYKAVRFNYANALVKGIEEHKFAPNDTMTRAQFVTILHRAEGEPSVINDTPFSDVAGGQWYSTAVAWASTNGIISGYSDSVFGADDPVTREQIAAIIYRYAQWKKLDVTQTADLSYYSDAGSISDWAQAAMNWSSATGLLQANTPETLAPGATATRAEAAVLFQRYIETIAKT